MGEFAHYAIALEATPEFVAFVLPAEQTVTLLNSEYTMSTRSNCSVENVTRYYSFWFFCRFGVQLPLNAC